MAKPKITRIKAGEPEKSKPETPAPATNRGKITATNKPADKKADQKSQKLAKKAEKKALKAQKRAEKAKSGKKPFILFRPFVTLGHYLRDSWHEIRQVRWPNRKATWKMLFAVLIYSAFFLAFLLLLDMFFSFIFKKILG